MRRLCAYTCLAAGLLFLSACHKSDSYSQGAKTADSLGGAISALVTELERTDTILLQRSIARFQDYRQFVQQNISDTIQKSEADNLQHFYAGGENLERFAANRPLLLARARLIHAQLTKLSQDIKNGLPEESELLNDVNREKVESGKLMDAGYDQQKKFHTGFEEFKNSLPGVELLIRSRNRGELPTIVKDNINL